MRASEANSLGNTCHRDAYCHDKFLGYGNRLKPAIEGSPWGALRAPLCTLCLRGVPVAYRGAGDVFSPRRSGGPLPSAQIWPTADLHDFRLQDAPSGHLQDPGGTGPRGRQP